MSIYLTSYVFRYPIKINLKEKNIQLLKNEREF